MTVPFAYTKSAYLILLGLFETVITLSELSYPMALNEAEEEWLERYRRNLYKGMIHRNRKIRWEK